MSTVTGRAARVVLVMTLTVVLFINYADRGLLSTAAPLLQSELALSDSQLGMLFSAFFWTYALMQIPIGWLADRFGAMALLMAGLFIWACATMLVGLAWSFVSLIALRLLLGLGESVGFPCVSKIVATAMPVEELGFANGLVGFGYCFGPAAGAFFGGLLMVHHGWRSAFFVFGATSLLWLWPLRQAAKRGGTADANREAHMPPRWREVLATPALWGTALGLFCANYVFFFMLSWLPVYLVRERGFSMIEMADLTSVSYVVTALCALLGGFGIDFVIRRGVSTTSAYKGSLVALHVGAVLCMVGMAYGPTWLAVCGLFLYQALNGLSACALYAVPEILGGARATGIWVGVQNSAGSLAGVAAPWITGVLAQKTGHFTMAFLVAAGVSLVGLAGWLGLVPTLRAIDWKSGCVTS